MLTTFNSCEIKAWKKKIQAWKGSESMTFAIPRSALPNELSGRSILLSFTVYYVLTRWPPPGWLDSSVCTEPAAPVSQTVVGSNSLQAWTFCCRASVASEQQHKQDLRRIYKLEIVTFYKNALRLFTRMHCAFYQSALRLEQREVVTLLWWRPFFAWIAVETG